jgi:ornithine cyclodeaminase/alanine dehydrogenase-like protein (mu-crystallin family)
MIRLISRQQVKGLLTYQDTIRIIEGAFIDISSGKAILPPRVRMDIPQRRGRQAVMMAFVESCEGLGMKFSTMFELDPQHHVTSHAVNIILNDAQKGGMVAIMDANYITEVRTAAGSAVATKYLARGDATTLAIIGTGVQGRSHLKAIPLVRPIKHVIAYDPIKESLDKFIHLANEELPHLKLEVVGSPKEAVKRADVVCTTSISPTPVVEYSWLKPGTHINAVGAWTPKTREVDSATVAAAKVVLDSRIAVMSEAGDILIPIQEGIIKEGHIYGELGEICNGGKRGRTNPEEITLYKSVGSAAMDMATAVVVFQRAVELGVGTIVEDLQ